MRTFAPLQAPYLQKFVQNFNEFSSSFKQNLLTFFQNRLYDSQRFKHDFVGIAGNYNISLEVITFSNTFQKIFNIQDLISRKFANLIKTGRNRLRLASPLVRTRSCPCSSGTRTKRWYPPPRPVRPPSILTRTRSRAGGRSLSRSDFGRYLCFSNSYSNFWLIFGKL